MISGIASIAFIVLGAGGESIADNNGISLKDAVHSALEKTETVAISQARINRAEARVGQARSRFFPLFSLGVSYQQQEIASGQQSYARFSLSQSVYEGGRDRANLSASQFDQDVQRHNFSVANYNTFATVARSFYAILSGEREVGNLQRTIELAHDRVKEIRSRANIGKSRRVEFMAAQAQLAVLEAQRMAAEGQVVTAREQFALITGLSRDAKLTEEKKKPETPEKIEVYLARLEKRPDIASIRSQIEGSRDRVSVARAGHLPSVLVGGNYYLIREGTQPGNNWDLGATLTLPLFAGGLVQAQIREASETVNETEFLLGQTRREAEIAVRTAHSSLVSAVKQIAALESALKSTEANYQEQEKNYRFAQATNLDVIQALNSFQDTKRTLDRTHYLVLSAWAELKAAIADVPFALVPSEEGGGP